MSSGWSINFHFFSASVEKFFIVYELEDGDEKTITTEDEQEAVVNDGDVVTVGCLATINSGSVEPQLDIAFDDESRTANAILNKSVTSETSDDDLILYNTQVKLSLVLGRIGRAQSRKRIKCTARVKGYEDRTESAVLKVKCKRIYLSFMPNLFLLLASLLVHTIAIFLSDACL